MLSLLIFRHCNRCSLILFLSLPVFVGIHRRFE
jgi:hypothetical protein